MEAYIKKSLHSGRQLTIRDISASTTYEQGEVVLFNDMLGFFIETCGGATAVATAKDAGTILPSVGTFIIEHESVVIAKAAPLVINLGDKVYWDAADNDVNKSATGNTPCGFCIKAAASTDETVEIYFTGAQGSHTVASGEVTSLEVDLTAAEIKALRATPQELVPAPGANKMLEFVGATLVLTAGTEVLTESADNLAIEYDDGDGAAVSEAIETTGFLVNAADSVTSAIPIKDAIDAVADVSNKNLALANTGSAEIAGNAANDAALRINISYRIVDLA